MSLAPDGSPGESVAAAATPIVRSGATAMLMSILAQAPLELGLESNMLRNLLQLGSFGLLAIGVIWLLRTGAPMLKEALNNMAASHAETIKNQTAEHKEIIKGVSADHKEAMGKMSADNKAAMERISADCKHAIEQVIAESKEAIERKQEECAEERKQYHEMMERERILASKEREEYRAADKNLREILQGVVIKAEIAARQGQPPTPPRPK